MEIVNYVGFNQTRTPFDELRDLFDLTLRKLNGNKRRDVTRKVRIEAEPFDFNEVLKKTGSVVNFIEDNLKKSGIAALSLVVLVSLCVVSVHVYSYFHTTAYPVSFENNYDSEMKILDKLMNSFALEETSEYSADGTLLDSKVEIDAEKLFRKPVTFQTYRVQSGDTISGITKKFGLSNISTLIAVNDINNVRQLCAGQKLKIPSIDGLYYTVQKGNTVGQILFIPGAKLDSAKLSQAMGELFKNPISARYRLTSKFGPRLDPITGARSNHTGIDMACAIGTPIVATASGKVTYSGVSPVFGNYVIINHGNGYQSLYGHMSLILAKKDQWVSQGTRIGLVGSTGYSTGPHLHFTVYKNGKLVDPLSLIK